MSASPGYKRNFYDPAYGARAGLMENQEKGMGFPGQ